MVLLGVSNFHIVVSNRWLVRQWGESRPHCSSRSWSLGCGWSGSCHCGRATTIGRGFVGGHGSGYRSIGGIGSRIIILTLG